MTRRELVKLAGRVGVVALVQMGLGRFLDAYGILDDLAAEAAALPRNYQVRAGDLWLNSKISELTVNAKGNGGTATVVVTDNTDAAFIRPAGAVNSLKMEVTVSGTQTFWNFDWTINESLVNLGRFSFAYWTNVTNFTGWIMTVLVSELSNYSNRYNYSPVTVAPNSARTGWNTVTLDRATPSSTTGSPNIANTFTRVRIQMVIPADAIGTWYFCPVYKNGYNRPKVVFSFDDQDSSQYENGFEVLDAHGLPGSQCIQTGFGGGLTVEQFREMQAAGWSFHNHSVDHTNLTSVSLAAAEAEVVEAQAWLNDNGFTYGQNTIVYPNGATNDALDALWPSLGYTHGAIVRSQIEKHWDGFEQPFRINRQNTDQSFSLATLKSRVDDCIKYGGYEVFYSHAILDGATGSNTERTTYAGLVPYVARFRDANILDVPPLQGLIDGMTNPRQRRPS